MARQRGLFDVDERLRELSAKDDDLEWMALQDLSGLATSTRFGWPKYRG